MACATPAETAKKRRTRPPLIGLLFNFLNQRIGNIVIAQCIGDCNAGINGVRGKVPHLSQALNCWHLVIG